MHFEGRVWAVVECRRDLADEGKTWKSRKEKRNEWRAIALVIGLLLLLLDGDNKE